jgi:elongation factor Ts
LCSPCMLWVGLFIGSDTHPELTVPSPPPLPAQVRRFHRITLGEGIKKAEANLADEVAAASQAQPKAPKAPEPKVEEAAAAPEAAKPAAVVQVSAKFVKELRDQTGAGMMDCKRALQECGGDAALATEWLRKKGFAGAAKKAGRTAAEGLIVGYLHPDCRFGVLVEANCETDFVAGNSKFYEFAQSIAVSIASNKEIQHVCVEDIPASVLAAERALALEASDLEGKPEDIKAKIVEGRVAKAAENMSLMNQPFVYDPEKTVGDVVKETITTLGENIKIRRFVRFDLGSGIEKKAADLAAEVAAMTGA